MLALALVFPPLIRAADIDVETATIADLQRAFQNGTLTSEKLIQTGSAGPEGHL